MTDLISMDEFQDHLGYLLGEEMRYTEETLDEVLNTHAMRLKGKLREISPKDTEDYAKGWRIKTAQRNHEPVKIIYNAAKPWLTSVLEYGEEGHGGRPHIRRALAEEIDALIEELAERL